MVRLNRNLKVLFIINLATSLGRGLIHPLFPLFLYGLGANVIDVSFVLFSGGIMAIIVMIPSGLLSDRYRRRNLLILSSIMNGLAAFYLTTIRNWETSILGFILLSCAFSVFLPARQTLIADNADSTSMTKTYSSMNIAWPVGSTIGPVIGGFLAHNYGWNCTFYVVTLISLFSIIPTYFFKKTYKGDKLLDKKKTKGAFFTRKVIILLFLFSFFQIFFSTAMGMLDPIIPLYLTRISNLDETAVGFFFSMGLGVATLVAQLPSGMLADKYGHKRILAYSILPTPIIMLFWPLMQSYSSLMAVYMLVVGLWGMTWSVAVAYLMNLTPMLERGIVISIRQTAVRLGFTIGPLIGGFFWHNYTPTTPFYISSVFFALSLFSIILLKKV